MALVRRAAITYILEEALARCWCYCARFSHPFGSAVPREPALRLSSTLPRHRTNYLGLLHIAITTQLVSTRNDRSQAFR